MAYQRKLGRYLSQLDLGELREAQWINFNDSNGDGFAQPDFYLVGPHSVVVFEAKLTQNSSGLTQIGQLYRPLLRHLYNRPVVGVLVCRNFRQDVGKWLIRSPAQVLDVKTEEIFTWHWLGT
jgi:hypothetical protein